MSHTYTSEAIVLSTKSYGEADKLITLFSKSFGKLTLIAKGIKRLKSRKRGSLEVFSAVKFFAHKTKWLPILTEVEIVNNFSELRKDLKKVSVAYFLLEVVSRTTRDEERHEEIYTLLMDTLKKLEKENKLKNLRREFSLQLMHLQGFIPQNQFVPNPDELLESVIERKLGSVRVGKKLQL